MTARVVSVNVGRPAGLSTGRRVVSSAIVKQPVTGPELRVAGPRVPCFKLEARFGVRGFQRRFLRAGRPGAYLAVVSEGDLQAGDPVEIVHRPDHDVSVSLVLEALLVDRSRVPELEPARADMLPKLAGWYAELA